MMDIKIDGRLQVTASFSLLKNARLVEWRSKTLMFVSVNQNVFDGYWRTVDPVFGRLICWINFSVGAEFLAKGVCLLNNIEIRTNKKFPPYPCSDFDTWAAQYCTNSAETIQATNFGNLGHLITLKNGQLQGKLKELCLKANASPKDQERLLAAYDLLRSIRNRDAHAYVPNVRNSHFGLVPDLFTDCFNLLLSWLPEGKQILNNWVDDAPNFVASI
jgi:hypothetical protein